MPTAGRILIVEDDFLGAERVRRVLEDAGYDVVGAVGRTAQALELAGRHAPDLAIVDMMLEIDVDGVHTATELVRRLGVKVLITTGFPDSVIRRYDLDGLACGVLRKPFLDRELLDTVAECLAPAGAA
ncbi:MAG TPA: response regulator [Geminicoccaceae bacterium]|nr:response regulator [Geminicoccaceae bacterium]